MQRFITFTFLTAASWPSSSIVARSRLRPMSRPGTTTTARSITTARTTATTTRITATTITATTTTASRLTTAAAAPRSTWGAAKPGRSARPRILASRISRPASVPCRRASRRFMAWKKPTTIRKIPVLAKGVKYLAAPGRPAADQRRPDDPEHRQPVGPDSTGPLGVGVRQVGSIAGLDRLGDQPGRLRPEQRLGHLGRHGVQRSQRAGRRKAGSLLGDAALDIASIF